MDEANPQNGARLGVAAWPAALLTLISCAACHGDHRQSMVHPAGPAAEHINELWWFLFLVLAVVFGLTMLLTGLAIGRRAPPGGAGPPLGSTRFIVVSGILVPAVILLALLVASLRSTVALRTPTTGTTVRIVGHQWWWHVEYPQLGIVTANELHLPRGEPVRLELESADVIHSLWVPNLTGKMDLVPGRTNVFWLQGDQPAVYRGQCAEFCGLQHARMGLHVVVLEREDFERWAARMSQAPAPPSPGAPGRRGYEVFFGQEAGCQACHAIAGTPATSALGPDLTHVASRRTLGAASVPNSRAALARWIADPHAFKAGNRMPATELRAADLEALVDYLMTLE